MIELPTIRTSGARTGALVAGLSFVLASGAWAAGAPPDVVASPDVYKSVAESSGHRLVEGTWKPGQRDQFHSHPAMLFYWLTDCKMRWHMPDGSTRDMTVAAGRAGLQAAVESHVVENVGTNDCRVIMFEETPAR